MSRRPAAPQKPPAPWTSARQTRPGREGAPTVYSGSRLLAAEKELQTLKCMLEQLEINRSLMTSTHPAEVWANELGWPPLDPTPPGTPPPRTLLDENTGGEAGRDEESNFLEAIRELHDRVSDAEDKDLQAAISRLEETWKSAMETYTDNESVKYMKMMDYQDMLDLVKQDFRSKRPAKRTTYDRFNALYTELKKQRKGGMGGSGGTQGDSSSDDEDMGLGEVDGEGDYLDHRDEQGDNELLTNQGKQGVGGPGGTHVDPSADVESQEGQGDAEGEDSGGVAEGTQGDDEYYEAMLNNELQRMPRGGNGIDPEQQENEFREQDLQVKREFEERKRKREAETRARGEGDTEEDKKDELYPFVLKRFKKKWGTYDGSSHPDELQADRDTLFRWRNWCRLIRSPAFFVDDPYLPAGSIAPEKASLIDSLDSIRRNVDGRSLDDNKRAAAAIALIRAADIIRGSSLMRVEEINDLVVDRLHNKRVEDTKKQLREQYTQGTADYDKQLRVRMDKLETERNERVEMYRNYFGGGEVDPPATDGQKGAPDPVAKFVNKVSHAETRRDMAILDGELRTQEVQEYIIECQRNGVEPDQLIIIWLSTSQS